MNWRRPRAPQIAGLVWSCVAAVLMGDRWDWWGLVAFLAIFLAVVFLQGTIDALYAQRRA